MSRPGWGIEPSYRDAFRRQRQISEKVLQRIREAMGGPPARDGGSDPVAIVRPGGRLPAAGEVTLEDGTSLGRLEALPPDAPIGYHRLVDDVGSRLLIAGPGRCHLPAGMRDWGWAVQLYAARSTRSWGIGDLGDLRELGEWSAGLGAGLLVVNPLHAPAPTVPIQPSPYFPSTRRFHDPLYLRVEEVPGADAVDGLERLSAAGRALNGGERIDRDAAFELKMRALQQIWDTRARGAGAPRGLEQYRADQGRGLRQWATYAAIAERHGPAWSRWPAELHRPGGDGARRFATDHAERIDFHEWLQWLLDEQLARAGAPLRLVQDMPVGVDREGADAWAWQDSMALSANIGAPPDVFNQAGQDWGLPPFIPHRLREVGYEPFITTLRASLRQAGGLRIDHAMGLFRLWWLPLGESPTDGAYVRYPTDEMLEILAIESVRAQAIVIGEDLGTVEPGVRRELARRRILSYRLAYFEHGPPSGYPRSSLAAVTTHDLPTVAGCWDGGDLELQRRAGIPPDRAGLRKLRQRLQRAARVESGASLEEVILAAYGAIAAAPSMLVSATLEDALRVGERPNLPGTIDEHPNWRLPLPRSLEELRSDPFVRRLADVLERARRA